MTDCHEVMAQEVFEHTYERVRYEITRFPLYDLKSALYYLLKYGGKKYSANPSLIRHFTHTKNTPLTKHDSGTRTEKYSPVPSLKISMVGDIMWMRKGWKEFLSEEVRSFLKGRDIVLGNLETPVSPVHRVIEYMPDLFSFNSPPAMLDQLAQCFTAVSIMNNHCLDQGIAGLFNTIGELDARNILHAGARAYDRGQEYAVIGKKESRIAFLAYAWGLNNVKGPQATSAARLNILNLSDPFKPVDYSIVKEHIRKAREERVDLVICSLHWGHEFEMYPTYHMMKVARDLISLGVDVIMGHHPHVLQPFEIIEVNADRPFDYNNIQDRSRPRARKAVVVYSLGNFVSAMYTKECLQSCIFNLNFVKKDDVLDLDTVSYIPTYCMKKQGGKLSTKVVNLLEELKKEHHPKRKGVLDVSYREITEHLGKAFIDDGEAEMEQKVIR
jgi:poly-gamma-glutamate synthesis protein (capsule biosynthesis protein)